MLRLFRRKGKTESSSSKTGALWSRSIGALFRRTALDDDFWDELEESLIVADVGAVTTMELLDTLRDSANDEGVKEPVQVRAMLRDEMIRRLREASGDGVLSDDADTAVLVVGVNGAGKTTSIAKLAHTSKANDQKVILAAADTFRAGAIEQIQVWGERVGVDVIAHQAGGDPGAVTFDALEAAKARQANLVIIDTAGRLHTQTNLMDELKKVRGVVARQAGDFEQRVLLVIDGTTGQNGLSQARAFTEAVECDGVILTKLDGTARGGIVLAIAGELGLPVLFIGTGETLDDLAVFDPDEFVDALLPETAAEVQD
ncbi:MAG: signal recognition particle-docking protein FtsY [Chloroflexi bacterium]|nr:signal recognition particle-docking protein FtsY [Chloroflexota bacterium]MBT4072186.1 signal recognition particle-docking protein FtsY [Chloroflexota bacterium]MBT4515436.1 signal recognition particle-docking protein FtsY [Chloroflexota bacterium]MBT6681804.1 signal recognition particle-docking protein FtsY [Chloroflexota bacterium]